MMGERTASRLAWSLFALAIALSSIAVVFLALSWREALPVGSFGFRGFTLLFVAAFGTVGALVASRQPANPIGWIFLAGAVLSGIQELAQEYAIYAAATPGARLGAFAAWIPAWIWIPGTGTMMFLLLLFPDGHLLSPRWRWVPWFGALSMVAASSSVGFAPGPLENFGSIENPYGIEALSFLGASGGLGISAYGVAFILAAASTVLRYRRSTGEARQQMKWLVASGVFIGLALPLSFLGQGTVFDDGAAYLFISVVVILAFLSVPVATGIAILQYRLFDVDVVIKKTVVFALITATLTLLFAGALALTLGGVIGGLLIAVTFGPVRDRARRIADRMVYGKRATPYEVLAEFSTRIGETYAADDVLPRMADVLRRATGADAARVWLRAGSVYRQVAAAPDDAPAMGTFPDAGVYEVRHQGETLGALSVAMPANDPMDPTREKLARDLASQAGLVLRNVQLVADLRESRRRIVVAADERARALERNIHDGAQQQLVALAVKQRLVAGLVDRDPDRARAMLEDLQGETNEAIETLRDLARGIYPPLLADKGLGSALEAQARRATVPVTVSVDGVRRHPREVEAAVYFSVSEALTNLTKYAEASRVSLEVTEREGLLSFAVKDDGKGFDPGSTGYGTGLQGMADRLAAVGGSLSVTSTPGGGTTVLGSVPVASAP